MAYRDAETLSTRTQAQPKFAKWAIKQVNVFQCLILSVNGQRREMFQHSATQGGWKTLLSADAPAALASLNRSVVQLVVVDLEGQHFETFRGVVEHVAARNGLLLVVCGNEGNVEEEVWVRQAGAWLYLPGAIDSGSFTSLCGESRQIAERLWKGNQPFADPHVTQQKERT